MPPRVVPFYRSAGGDVVAEFFMVFDVESVGLHGVGFAVGWVVVSSRGTEVEKGKAYTPAASQPGTPDSHKWVAENVGDLGLPVKRTRREVRDAFWQAWMHWKAQGAVLAADCPWPVEARFLIDCVNDAPEEREWQGPYPLIDVASVRLAVGLDPLGTDSRLADELPVHDPLADARQSARLLLEALRANV